MRDDTNESQHAHEIGPRYGRARTGSHRLLGVLAVVLAAVIGLAASPFAAPAGATEPGQNCPCSLWSAADVPEIADFDDPYAVELGVHFSVDVAAPMTGLRFYKSAANTGTHVGSLWTLDGTLLARATFVDETESGWQQVSFNPAVVAVPGQIYVASYHTPSGHYSVTPTYFLHTSRDNGILHAPAGTPDVPNGIFAYSPEPTFPTGTWNDNNYWIDVVVGPLLTSLSVAPASSLLITGDTVATTATGTYWDSSTADLTATATWTTSDPAIATVGADGVVTATGAGTATITATSGTVSSSTTVVVRGITGVAITGVPGTLPKGLGAQATATAVLSDGTMIDVTASLVSSDPSVATVTATGQVDAVSLGSAVLSGSYRGVTGSAPIDVVDPVLSSLSVTPASSTITTGDTVVATATGTYSDGSTSNGNNTVIWTTSNPAVATVGLNGVVTATGGGTATITATSGSVSSSATVIVRGITGVTITGVPGTLPKGLGAQATATALLSDGTTIDVTASLVSSNPSVATVTAAGQVKALSLGSAVLTASYRGVSGSASLTVVAPLLSSLSVTPATSLLITGDTVAVTATGTFSDASTANVTGTVIWTTSNPAIATVGANGVVTAKGRGTATITATSGVVSSSATVTVRDVTGVSISGVPATLAKGLTATVAATALLSDGATVDVTSSLVSCTPSVASVTAGQLKAVSVGSAVISATYRGVKGSASITVTAAQIVSLSTSPATVSLKRFSSTQLKAVATYTDGTTVDVTGKASWSSSNILGATVCGGRVTTYGWLGTLRIVATYAGKSATTTVTVIR